MQALKSWEFHFKALIQAKGFLKIIEFVLVIITFSILASYTAQTGVGECVSNVTTGVNLSSVVSSHYPFDTYNVALTTLTPGRPASTVNIGLMSSATMISAGRQATLFVAWGVITMLYCIVAVVVYIVTMAKADDLGKIYLALVYSDFGFTLFWCFMWLVVSAEWASGQYRLLGALKEVTISSSVDCVSPPTINFADAFTLLQSNIAVVFGFLNLFVWLANIWWVLIDCPMYGVIRKKILTLAGRDTSSSYDPQ